MDIMRQYAYMVKSKSRVIATVSTVCKASELMTTIPLNCHRRVCAFCMSLTWPASSQFGIFFMLALTICDLLSPFFIMICSLRLFLFGDALYILLRSFKAR